MIKFLVLSGLYFGFVFVHNSSNFLGNTDDFFSKDQVGGEGGCCLDVTPCMASRSSAIILLGCLSHILSTHSVFAPH